MKLSKILITKTTDAGDNIEQAVRDAGFEPLFEPMLSVDYVTEGWPVLVAGRALVFTSSHGVRAFAAQSMERRHPVYTVGENTAETARSLGFADITSAAGTGNDLAELIVAKAKTGLISPIYMRAAEVSRDLKRILAGLDVLIDEFVAYKAIPTENISLNLLKSLDNREIYAVMFTSSQGGQVFADLMEQYDRTSRLKTTKALCISDAVLKSVSVLPFQQAVVAETPDRHGMMDLLGRISVNKD